MILVQSLLGLVFRAVRESVKRRQHAKVQENKKKKQDGYSHLQTRLQTRMISGESNKADVDADCKHCLRKQNRHSVISGEAKYCGICGHKKPEGHCDERLFKEEHGKKWALDKWDDETYEAENDVFGLTGSYLTVQAIIFNITHTMEVLHGALRGPRPGQGGGMEVTGDEADLTIFSIINALSTLVGFSWEHAFHLGVEVVAVKLGYPVAGQFVLALIVAAVAIVPWRRHILQKVLHLEKEVAESKHMSLHKQEEQNIREMRQDSEGGPMELLASTAQMHETSEPKD
eukprot:CAMPEP_0177437200 /NCGR_PEP_ID=MMETSP0369-20130122/2059_1 /TAXON_ID=447022 ORGANISM="Scrippsiella hangoei-like, Strain SHHI-4" /NCGR_SAMPLE_ID=MMETSP0369 /ASSEMBLY_ACC=CAM_ASM_000364 /LENGTH=286 /DNA_ID=CAMNT_0018908613 /DNA_START=89 /DNA_END=951 /DNA_ORIENTATION=-